MTKPTDSKPTQKRPRELTITRTGDDKFRIAINRDLSLTGTGQQLVVTLLTLSQFSKAELWLMGEDEPRTFSNCPLPEWWKPAFIVTQRSDDLWTLAFHQNLITTCETSKLLELLASTANDLIRHAADARPVETKH